MATIALSDLGQLSAAERVRLAVELWDSIGTNPDLETLPYTEAQRREVRRRLEEHRRDPSTAIPWDEVRERIRRSL